VEYLGDASIRLLLKTRLIWKGSLGTNTPAYLAPPLNSWIDFYYRHHKGAAVEGIFRPIFIAIQNVAS
jgi:hypothetical protein